MVEGTNHLGRANPRAIGGALTARIFHLKYSANSGPVAGPTPASVGQRLFWLLRNRLRSRTLF